MTTAAILSRKGVRVLLVESRATLGGRASYVERDGFVVDYGIHAHRFGADGAAASAYRELGESVDLTEPGPGIIFHRGESYPLPTGKLRLARIGMISRKSEAALARALGRLAARRPSRNYDQAVSDVLSGRLDADARSMLATISGLGLISPELENTSAGELIWFLRKAARSSAPIAFPRDGCRQHVRRLGAIIRDGGEIRTGFRVGRILLDEGAVTGIEGREEAIHSRAIVAAFPLPRVAALLPPGVLTGSLEYRMGAIRPTLGISWDVALRRPASETHAAFSTDPLIIGAFTSNIDPGLCPAGKQLSSWCMPLPLSDFQNAGLLKQREQKLRGGVFKMFPRMEENIEWERMMRLPVLDGAAPSFWQPWPDRPGPADSGVTGLFFAGDTVGVPGQSGDIAFTSAIECARAVESYLA